MKTVKALRASDRAEIARHFHALPAEDRRHIFGAPLAAADVERYVRRIDFEREQVFGIYENDLMLEGVAHLMSDRETHSAQLGLSVLPLSRGAGYGYALLVCAGLQAQRQDCRRLFVHELMQNRVMLHLARKAGMMLVLPESGCEAHLALGEAAPQAAPVAAPLDFARRYALVAMAPAMALGVALLAAA